MNLAKLLRLRETLWYSASILVSCGNLRACARKNYVTVEIHLKGPCLNAARYFVPNLINDLSATTNSKGVHTK